MIRKSAVVYVALLLGSLSSAQFVWNPLLDIYAPQISEGNQAIPCILGIKLSLSNNLSFSSGDWGTIIFDTERINLLISARKKTSFGDFSVHLPLGIYYGGFLDTILNPIHQVLNQPYSINPNKNFIYIGRKNYSIVSINSTIFGIGDPSIGWSITVAEGSRLGMSLGLPIGNFEQLMGTGGYRIVAFFEYNEGDLLGLSSQLIVPLEKQQVFKDLEQKDWSFIFSIWIGIPDRNDRIAISIATSPIGIGGAYTGTSIGLSYRLSNFTFIEDLTTTHPDVSFVWKNSTPCHEVFGF